MPAERLIELLDERRVLPERLLTKLRAKVADNPQPMTAVALAKFLVQKRHLTQHQARELLSALPPESLGDSGLSPPPGASSEPDSSVGVSREAAEDEQDGDEDSSIFSGLLPRSSQRSDESDAASSGELTLAYVDEPDEDADQRTAELNRQNLASVIDLEQLSAEKQSIGENAKLMEDAIAPDDYLTASPKALRSSPSSILGKGGSVEEKVKKKVERRLATKTRLLSTGGRKKKTKRQQQWDSPQLLIGGGLLVLLVLCGGAVAFYLFAGSGDERLAQARQARDAGSYMQAVQLYEEFLQKYKRHSGHSAARVELSMVRLRQAAESGGSLEPALRIAQQELPAIEEEPSFGEIRDELADLLPEIAAGLARQAEAATDRPEEATRLAAASDETLALVRTAKYVPKALRDDAELARIEETLARVRQRLQSHTELAEALAAMKAAIASGDPRTAYTTHKQLLREHPELAGNEELAAMILETSAAEKEGVKFIADEQAAETSERPTPWVAILATGNRQARSTAPASGTFCASIDGALYAFDVATGRLLWRRYVGFGQSARPTPIGDDVLVTDSKYEELLRLNAATGSLVWRQSIGEPFAQPLAVGRRAYVPAESGRLYVIDLDSGDRMGYLQFAQPLEVTPTVDRTDERIYLTGDHSSLYAVSLRDLTCLGVYYLGHSSGSIRVSPALVLNKIAVIENDGVATCRLRLLSLAEDGSVAKDEAERRLTGLGAAPPLVAARRLIVVTDRGALDAFDVTAGEGEKSLTPVATREPTSRQPLVRHVLLTQGAIWVGDTRLTKFAIAPTGNRLPVESIDDSFAGSTFDHPFGLFGETLVYVRRPAQRAGVVVGAIDAETGRSYWENELAVPPAATPIVDEASRTLAFADVNGLVFRFDEEAVRSRVQDQPLSAGPAGPKSPTLTVGIDLGSGRATFTSPRETDQILLYDPGSQGRALRWASVPSTIACAPAPLGSGVLVPTEVGQVFYVDPATGRQLATPFQPRLQPRTKLQYRPACPLDAEGRQFVVTDGHEKIYLVNRVERPSPHFAAAVEASVGPYPIISPLVVIGETVVGVTEAGQMARYRLPSLEAAGQTDLPADVVWGPYRMGELLLVATADEKLVAVGADGDVAWIAPLDGGDLAGPPLASGDRFFLAYRGGQLQARSLADGQATATLNVEHPLAAGPVEFLGRIVLTAHDGTLLVVDKP